MDENSSLMDIQPDKFEYISSQWEEYDSISSQLEENEYAGHSENDASVPK